MKTLARADEFYLVDVVGMESTKGRMVTAPTQAPCQNLGFLSVFQEQNGFVGGYLVTNSWGRPLEFRLSSAVAPNKVQQILYGNTLPGYLCGEVIGKTLIDKTPTAIALVLTDNPSVLELRRHVNQPVVLWRCLVDPDSPVPALEVAPRLFCHPEFSDDAGAIRELLDRHATLDFNEPFSRIREAMSEARKLGVTARSAAA